jgi:hypothetical protein
LRPEQTHPGRRGDTRQSKPTELKDALDNTGEAMRLQLTLCTSLVAGAAYGQTPPTATEAFNLRIKCKEMVMEKTQTMTEDFYRLKDKAPELEFFYSSSRYDAKANRCYGDFHWKQKFRTGPLKDREMRSLYDMQTDDLVAFNKNESGKKVGLVFDHSHQSTMGSNLGWDDADAYMNEMIEDKK